ncbi:MAG: ACT domain-containing protein [Bacillota bacterium]
MEHLITNGEDTGSRVIITVLGKDRVGIISGISTICAENGVNILDLSQTILQGFFTMVMVVDISNAKVSFNELKEKLEAKGQELGLQIKAQHEDVFQFMHRI